MIQEIYKRHSLTSLLFLKIMLTGLREAEAAIVRYVAVVGIIDAGLIVKGTDN